jgi:chromosome segregation ATPase
VVSLSKERWDFQSCSRAEFEEEGLKADRERLTHLENVLRTERGNLEKYEAQKVEVQQWIQSLEGQADKLKGELGEHQEVLDERTKAVEHVKRTTMKAGRVLDQALKDISNCVSGSIRVFCGGLTWLVRTTRLRSLRRRGHRYTGSVVWRSSSRCCRVI